MARTEKVWHLLPNDPTTINRLAAMARVSPVVAQLLVNREITDPVAARRFLDCPLSGLHPPLTLTGVAEAAERVAGAIVAKRKICVYGDYDVDGVTGTAIMIRLLGKLGADVIYHTPDRISEGYGLHSARLKDLAQSGVSLVISVDCGIASVVEADEAKKLGLELIITDHHEMKVGLDGPMLLLDDPITLYYGAIEPALEVVDGAFGEVSYAIALPKDDTQTHEAVDRAIEELARDGTLATIYARWGLWNEPTARLLAGPPPQSTVAEAHDAWRAAVGKPLPFWTRVRERYPATLGLFARGALLTLVVSLCAMMLAVSLGVTLALSRVYGPALVRALAVTYIEVFRGTPLIVQLTMVYFGLPELGLTLSPFVAGVIALGLNYAAAEAENYRAGLESVPTGQLDAARTLGLSKLQTLRHVAVPQALRVALPPTTNDFIALLKDSSLVSVVTLTELTKTYTTLASSMRDHLGLGIVVALFYLLLSLPFARLSRLVEQRLGSKVQRAI